MLNKKILVLGIILIFLPLISATPDLQIDKNKIKTTVIPELDNPALYELTITNNGQKDIFEIYSLVGVKIKPDKKFELDKGETKKINLELRPRDFIYSNEGSFHFVYKIEGEETGIQKDSLTIKILSLKNSLDINSYNIGLNADQTKVYVKNLGDYDFNDLKVKFNSAFFTSQKTFDLGSHEKKEFTLELDKEKADKLTAGAYTLTSQIEVDNIKETIENSFEFKEQANVDTNREESGFFINELIVEKRNEGNLPIVVQSRIKKNVISRLFTFFNSDPASIEREGLTITYTFQQEVSPGDSYTIKATTNWIYPIILLIAIIVIIYLARLYIKRDLIVKKKATYAKTKSGKFALKVKVIAKAKHYVENINIVDKIPSLVKVHKRFGATEPDKVDEKNRRLEWNIESLQQGEERVFSYVICSDVAPVGKFELPTATAVYEKEGKIKENESNKVFFLTNRKKKAE